MPYRFTSRAPHMDPSPSAALYDGKASARYFWRQCWRDECLHFRVYWSLSPDRSVLTIAHPDGDLAGQVSVLERASPHPSERLNEQHESLTDSCFTDNILGSQIDRGRE